MDVSRIATKIVEDARQAASALLRDAHVKADALQAQSDARIAERREQALVGARADIEAQRDHMLRMAALEQRKEMLAMKRELIDQTFEEALARLCAMPLEQERALVRELLLRVAQGGERIACSQASAQLYSAAFLADVNAALAGNGARGALTLSPERRALRGGFVLLGEGVEVNVSYEALLRGMRGDLETEVAARLFP